MNIDQYIKNNNVCLFKHEIEVIEDAIRAVPNCKFLVFGVGFDSELWITINIGGETVFIEDNSFWYNKIKYLRPDIKIFLVEYPQRIQEWKTLLDKPDQLRISLPSDIMMKKWDVIFVDGPLGNYGYDSNLYSKKNQPPGRMYSIYMSSQLAKEGGHILVHDCCREIENVYSNKFLKKDNLILEVTGGYRAGKGVLRKYVKTRDKNE